MSMQALFPVYLSRNRKPEETTVEDYDQAVSVNEDNLNQNLNILYKEIESLQATVAALSTNQTEV